MSRAAKTTLAASIAVSALTVFGVHFMQAQESRTMYAGVERDEARQAAKKAQRQRQMDLEMNQQREAEFQKMQPTKGYAGREETSAESSSSSSSSPWTPRFFSRPSSSTPPVAAHSVVEQAEDSAATLKSKASGILKAAGVGGDEDKSYIASRWALNGLEMAAVAATPLYVVRGAMRGTFTVRRLARANWTLPLAGAATGYASGYIYSSQLTPPNAASKALAYRHDASAIRRDDYYIIGGVVGGLLTPAVFLGRTGLINGLLGGGLGLGGTGGLGYGAYKKYFDTSSATPTEGTTGKISDAVRNAADGTPLEKVRETVRDARR